MVLRDSRFQITKIEYEPETVLTSTQAIVTNGEAAKTEIEALEKTLGDLSDKMLIGVAFKYGKDSSEYEMAGGVRKSERIRRSTASRLKAELKILLRGLPNPLERIDGAAPAQSLL